MAIVFTDMALDEEDQSDMTVPCVAAPNKKMVPQYPWNLQIALTEKQMEKLNLDPEDAVVGGIVHLHALARITSVSSTQVADGEDRCRCELQIQQLAVESEDDENEEADAPRRRPKLREAYGK